MLRKPDDVDEVPQRAIRRDSSRRGMRLLEVTSLLEIREHVANGSGRQVQPVFSSQRPASHGRTCGDELRNDGEEDSTRAVCQITHGDVCFVLATSSTWFESLNLLLGLFGLGVK